jgi:hypothetical protein
MPHHPLKVRQGCSAFFVAPLPTKTIPPSNAVRSRRRTSLTIPCIRRATELTFCEEVGDKPMKESSDIWKSPQGLAAVDPDALSGYVRRIWTEKEPNTASDVCGMAQPSNRKLAEKLFPDFIIFGQRWRQLGGDEPGKDGVDPDAVRPKFVSCDPSEHVHSGLRRTIRRLPAADVGDGHGAHIHDASAASFSDGSGLRLERPACTREGALDRRREEFWRSGQHTPDHGLTCTVHAQAERPVPFDCGLPRRVGRTQNQSQCPRQSQTGRPSSPPIASSSE